MKPKYPPVKPGNVYGSLTILFETGKDKWGRKLWRCKCACGAYRTGCEYELKRGVTVQCNECGNKVRADKLRGRASVRRIDMKGKIFGRLTVIEFARTEDHHAMWKCQCLCGNYKDFSAVGLRQEWHYSCGCVKRDREGEREVKTYKPRIPRPKPVEPEPAPVKEAPIPEDNGKQSLVIAARKSFTPWPDIAELVGMPVEWCKAVMANAA